MSQNDLSLDRDKIHEVIQSLDHINIVSQNEIPAPRSGVRYIIESKDKPVGTSIISIFYKDSKTSIQVQGKGKEQCGDEVAKHIKEKCAFGSLISRTLTFKDVNEHAFGMIHDYLIKDAKTSMTDMNLPHGKKYTYTGPQQDTIDLSLFGSGTLLIQGKQQFIYSDLIVILGDVFGYKEVIQKQIELLDSLKSVEETLSEFEKQFPNSHVFLGEKLANIISPSILFKDLPIELTDYSSFVYPILRGLEGVIKKILTERGIEYLKGEIGSVFEYKHGKQVLLSTITAPTEIVTALENLYNYYCINRHGLFHVQEIIDYTRTLDTKGQALKIIEDCSKLIDSNYLLIKDIK